MATVRSIAAGTALAETFLRDGVIHLPGVLDDAAMDRIGQAFAASLEDPGRRPRVFYRDTEGAFLESGGDEASRSLYLDIARDTGIADVVRAVCSGDDLWYMGEQFFLKEGGARRRTPWHQDTSYLRMTGDHLLAAWISLDALPKEHSLEFVRGSHRGVLYNGAAFDPADDTAPLYASGALPRLPDIQSERDKWDIVSWPITPGDIVLFHLGILHGGAGTAPDLRRRTVSMRFMGSNVVYDERPRDDGAPVGNDAALAGVYAGLKPGDPFRHPSFARV